MGWGRGGVALIFLAVRGKLNCANFGHIMLLPPPPFNFKLLSYAQFMYLGFIDDTEVCHCVTHV
jgi:hypothetical protein